MQEDVPGAMHGVGARLQHWSLSGTVRNAWIEVWVGHRSGTQPWRPGQVGCHREVPRGAHKARASASNDLHIVTRTFNSVLHWPYR